MQRGMRLCWTITTVPYADEQNWCTWLVYGGWFAADVRPGAWLLVRGWCTDARRMFGAWRRFKAAGAWLVCGGWFAAGARSFFRGRPIPQRRESHDCERS
eukprot:TRINITY_DN5088_c0_g1_i2.p2 TRINITY_DN5088_c0_g1~~TRINITY_DN5088_c0_g1_i2.p2  ORF type:complete len:100 (+),score=3.04 TRINITY_DN5088_c0_g1_i2:202-501(+)